MSNTTLIFDTARRTLAIEIQTLTDLRDSLDEAFAKTIQHLRSVRGRIVVTGVGKSALVAQKIAATFNSTGTPAMYMHAGDALHGDLGMVQEGDTILCLSKSGETEEVCAMLPTLRQLGHPLIAMVARANSTLAREADYLLLTPVTTEADPHNLAPTASAIAQMAMGDALAATLGALRGFGPADFAKFHPGGALGRRLTLTLGDLASHNERPRVLAEAPLPEVILEMTNKRLGATAVVDEQGLLLGLITDGDLRRAIGKGREVLRLSAKQLMTAGPRTLAPQQLATEGLAMIEAHGFNHVVLAEEGRYAGLVHLHDFVRVGMG